MGIIDDPKYPSSNPQWYRDQQVAKGRKKKEKKEAQEQHDREEPVINKMIDEDTEDANSDGGPSRSAEEESARNDWAARYFSRNEHFQFGHDRSRY